MTQLVIGLSGTPGTGKTTIANILTGMLSALHLNLTEIAIQNDFILEDDLERNTKVADLDRIQQYLTVQITSTSRNIIIEGHYADIIPDRLLTMLIILRTSPNVLEKRLIAKNFFAPKVLENLQSEILGSCTKAALDLHNKQKLYELDTSFQSPEDVAHQILRLIQERPRSNVGQINWMHDLSAEETLRYFP
ncbi:MAG: hypothetical protein EU536_03700 [Promethearchaeota archaeon]|nr:MAG: hypothetical protein EU536_03700 [Candidatus Lokiarchaeota archaeon]